MFPDISQQLSLLFGKAWKELDGKHVLGIQDAYKTRLLKPTALYLPFSHTGTKCTVSASRSAEALRSLAERYEILDHRSVWQKPLKRERGGAFSYFFYAN